MIKQIKPVILFLISVFTLLLAYGNQVYAVDRFQGWQDKNTTVRGKVTDSEGQPLIGATVNVVGTKTVEVTDLDGNFNISAPIKSVLEIRFFGYTTRQVEVTGDNFLDIVLSVDNKTLDEVIVVGYGTTSIRKNSTAIATVENEKVLEVPFSDMGSTLQGRVPGVIVQQGSAEPGQNAASVSIRGNGAPLYVIDGFVATSARFMQLNKADIESITILKDAASTAVYGMNAGNGVIVVTTKKGKAGTLNLSFQSNFAFNTPSCMTERMNAYDYATAVNNLFQGLGYGKESFKTAEEMKYIKDNVSSYTNWENEMMKKYAPQSEHTLTLTGGTQNIKFFGSVNYLDQDGITKGDKLNYDRYNYRTNVTGNWDKIGISAGLGVNGTYTDEHYPNASAYTIYSRIKDRNPFEIAYNKDGTISNQFDNPALILDSPGEIVLKTIYNQVSGNLTWNIPGLKGLSIGANGLYSVENQDRKDWLEKATYYDAEGNPTVQEPGDISLTRSSYSVHRYDINLRADYKNSFAGVHNVSATFVHNRQYYHSYSLSAYSNTFYTTAIKQIQNGDAESVTASNGESERASMGFVGRLHYDYDNRYMVEFAGREDGSDCFPKDHRFGFFPSVSIGWAISEEPFFKGVKNAGVLDYLKFRASYGSIGINGADHDAYAYMSTYNYNSNAYVVGGHLVNSITPGATPSINMTWYTRKKWDLGVDFTTLKEKLEGSLDFFFESTKGYLSSASYEFTDPIGHSLPLIVSDAEDRSEGLDGAIKWTDYAGDFQYSIGANFTWYHAIAFKTNEDKVALSNPYTRNQGRMYGYLGYGYLGTTFYNTPEEILNNPKRVTSTDLHPGDLWYKDANGDGKIDGQDQRAFGNNSSPRFVYGFDISASWKGFRLLANIQGTGPRQAYMSTICMAKEGERRLDFKYQLDTWSETNKNATFPRPGNQNLNNGNNYAGSDFWAVNTSYVRLKSLTLSYDFKNSLLANAGWIQHLSAFVSGVNLLAIGPSTKFADPEAGTLDSYAYPMMKTYSIGFQLEF